MKKTLLQTPLVALSLLLVFAFTSCSQQSSPAPGGINTDPTGISALDLRLTSWGDVEWQVTGEKGIYVFRIGDVLPIFIQERDAPYFIMGGVSFYALSPQGTFHAYLKRARDGKWVHAWLDYTFTFREDGTGTLTVTSPMRREAVPNEDALPFYLGENRDPLGNVVKPIPRFKNPPLSPLILLEPVCLQGPSWPFGSYRPTNTHPYFPPVAPKNPPALLTAYSSEVTGEGFAFIRYVNGRYAAAVDALDSYSVNYYYVNAFAPTPEEGSMEVRNVIYTVRWDPYSPLDRRWVRIYTRNPLRMHWEGSRLVCEDSGGYVVELMPEDFTIPGYNYDTGVFEMHKGVPMTLPPEMDPYAGR
ncbi:MAG: hypothetical protein ACK4G4_12150 [Thermus sp.]|uniref:hypothetical protein n=1 Tax=Thermus sp. TaxID=275 RepID=UPI00391BD6A7